LKFQILDGWKEKNYGVEMRKVEEWEVEFLQFGMQRVYIRD
jgi:hypothetical protein